MKVYCLMPSRVSYRVIELPLAKSRILCSGNRVGLPHGSTVECFNRHALVTDCCEVVGLKSGIKS